MTNEERESTIAVLKDQKAQLGTGHYSRDVIVSIMATVIIEWLEEEHESEALKAGQEPYWCPECRSLHPNVHLMTLEGKVCDSVWHSITQIYVPSKDVAISPSIEAAIEDLRLLYNISPRDIARLRKAVAG